MKTKTADKLFAIGAVGIITAISFTGLMLIEKHDLKARGIEDDKITESETETPEKWQIQSHSPMSVVPADHEYVSGMPCETITVEIETTEAVTEEPSTEPSEEETTAPETEPEPSYRYFSVDGGQFLAEEYQEYAQDLLREWDMEWYFPHFICQCYQESRYDQSRVSASGDYGLMQLKGEYHDYFRSLVGHPEWDLVNDPYANIYTGLWIVRDYWSKTYSLEKTLSTYYTGVLSQYNAEYVHDVRQWEDTLREEYR